MFLHFEYILEMETEAGLEGGCHGGLWNIDEKAMVVGGFWLVVVGKNKKLNLLHIN